MPDRPPPRVIVLVDDVEQVTAIASDYLERRLAGVKVLATSKPAEALAWLKTQPRVDLVLSDNHMGDMDGLTLLTQARDARPETMRALMTAYLDLAVTPEELSARGVHALIRKPWEWSEFARFVGGLLGIPVEERARIEREGPIAFPRTAFAELAQRGVLPKRTEEILEPRRAMPGGPAAPAEPAAPMSARVRLDPETGQPRVACPHCQKDFELLEAKPVAPAPTTEEDEARRILALLRQRPGIAARVRALQGAGTPPGPSKAK